MTCQLYRHFDAAGDLLYVGISLSAIGRLAQHRASADWFDQIAKVEIEQFETRDLALAAEAAAIDTERPRHNKLPLLIAKTVATECAKCAKRRQDRAASQKRWRNGRRK